MQCVLDAIRIKKAAGSGGESHGITPFSATRGL